MYFANQWIPLNAINKLKSKTRSTRIVLSELLVHSLSGGTSGRGCSRLLHVFVAQHSLGELELSLLHTGTRRTVDTVNLPSKPLIIKKRLLQLTNLDQDQERGQRVTDEHNRTQKYKYAEENSGWWPFNSHYQSTARFKINVNKYANNCNY